MRRQHVSLFHRGCQKPIFYPVATEAYARQIARDWNTKHGQRKGYVTRFEVRADYMKRYEKHVVGGRDHEEYWIPAEDLEDFNRNIVGRIDVIAAFDQTGASLR